MTDVSQMSDSELLALYAMPSLVKQESGGRAGVLGPQTKYGRAEGMTQMLPATARMTAQKIGVPWRPELMRGNTPEAADYQERLGRAYLQEGIEATGSLEDGLRYYHGGPDRKLWGPKTERYAQEVTGRLGGGQGAPAADLSGLSDDELLALYNGGKAQPRASAPQAPAKPLPGLPISQPQPERRSQVLGFEKGLLKPLDNAAIWLEGGLNKLGVDTNAINTSLGLPSAQGAADSRKAYLAQQAKAGVQPGRIGEFGGNILGTLALGRLPGGVLAQGAAGGALLSEDPNNASQVLRDMALGAVTAKVTDVGLNLLGKSAQKLLAKKPEVMTVGELEQAKRALYKAVDDSGYLIPSADAKALSKDVQTLVRARGGPKAAKLYSDSDAIVAKLDALSRQKGGIPLTQLEDLRGQIYTDLVKPGGKEAVIGQQMRAKIDDLIARQADQNGLIQSAREMNTRWSKANYIDKAAKSADRAAERTYGGDFGRKLKDRLNPLVDEMMPNRNLRNGTPDEMAAIEKIVRGTKAQNAASTVGGMLDPRRLGGKILTGITTTAGGAAAPFSLGTSLLIPAAQMGAGMGLTKAASDISRNNLDDLLRLVAVGGSRAALQPIPTAQSAAAAKALELLRPLLISAGVAGASQATAKPKAKAPSAPQRR